MSTASIIIIGDEILANKFTDENTPYLLSRCAQLHLEVLSVQIIPDNLDRIANTVKVESERKLLRIYNRGCRSNTRRYDV